MTFFGRMALISGALAALMVAAEMPSSAFAQGVDFSSYNKANANKPIDIESDRLEVDDKTHLATFIGRVSATQGDYNLKSKRLEVTYEKAAQQGQNGAPAAKPVKAAAEAGDPAGNGQIKFIKAIGDVVVISTKDDQRASGNEGFFDVKAQKITLTGDVTLTQKGNVIKGEKLAIDLTTGRAIVDPDTKKRVRAILQKEGGGGGEASINPFTGKKKDKSGADKPSEKPQEKPSEWDTKSQ